MVKRILAALALAVIGLPPIILGGAYYTVLIALLLGIAAWEFHHIFCAVDCNASQPILIGSVVLIVLSRDFFPAATIPILTFSVLAAMTWHLFEYEKGRNKAATDFSFTVAGIIYIGWIGGYLIDIRNLPDGLWWILLVLPAIWVADAAAYFIGSRWGRHQLSPRLSPKKSWEGYWAGVIFGILITAGLAALWHIWGSPSITWWKGAIIGGMLSILTTLGDLGESMFKRQAGVKDSSNIIPGHGGVLDRIDSWIWGAALGYFAIFWFFL
jgi:phosphatidate cytidylyltransferase